MATILDIKSFLAKSEHLPIVDVRAPLEFEQGHIPGAINIPLFTDNERARVGTVYKKDGKQPALLLGLKLVGPKMSQLAQQVLSLNSPELLVHCWRGGMRSSSMAWLFETVGIKCYILDGGYKTYRHFVLDSFSRPYPIRILSGATGSGKTELLHYMKQLGQQIIDLEALAHHKGSAFGALGQLPQPSTEQFENNLYAELQKLDLTRTFWLEDESLTIGRNQIPKPFHSQMQTSVVIRITVDKQLRIKRLLNEYGQFDKTLLTQSIQKINKRLGFDQTKFAMEALESGDLSRVAEISLNYYDKAYLKQANDRPAGTVYNLVLEGDNYYEYAEQIIQFADGFKL